MKVVKQTKLKDKQKEQILKLWNNEYPEKLAYNSIVDFENYLNKLTKQNHYLLVDENEKINGWATTFIRENEKWFAIIVSEKLHRKGFGTKILNELKNNENALNGWVIDHNSDKKINGNFYQSPLKFYLKNGFKTLTETRLELEIMSAVKIKWTKNSMTNKTNLKYTFHHLGIPTEDVKPYEHYSENFKMYTSDNRGKFRIHFHRFEEDSPLHSLIKNNPHIAFKVENLILAIQGQEILLGPYEPIEGYKVAIINDGGMPIELVETNFTDEELWGKAKEQDDLNTDGLN